METATEQFTARKSLLKNESGNILVIFSFIALITGSIGYWMTLTTKVDKEISGLGATQATSYLRSDFQNTIKKALQGKLSVSACPILSEFKTKFYDFLNTDPKIEKNFLDNPGTSSINEVVMNPQIKCFFNPARYDKIKWDKVKILIQRNSEPSFISLSNFISVEVLVAYKINGTPRSHKFQIKYRIDVLTLNHYGLIFTNSLLSPLINLQGSSNLKINSTVLFDLPVRINSSIPLNNMISLPDYQRLSYQNDVYTPASSFNITDDIVSFLNTHSISEIFKKGIQYNSLPKDISFKMPYEINPNEWKEYIDMIPITQSGYPLPKTNPQSVIYNSLTGLITHYYSGEKLTTQETYDLYPEHKKEVSSSCKSVLDLEAGVYNLYLFNHLDEDFTIDFSDNKDPDYPPVFCGIIAAKNLKIILNNESSSSNFFQHHLIGKFILSGGLIIQNSGHLNIHDISEFNGDQYDYYTFPIESQNLRTQFYNQKYYSTQNFFLPVFRPNKYPSVTGNSLLNSIDRFYVSRSTRVFFNTIKNIPGLGQKLTRTDNILSPDAKDLINRHKNNLVFEVFDAE